MKAMSTSVAISVLCALVALQGEPAFAKNTKSKKSSKATSRKIASQSGGSIDVDQSGAVAVDGKRIPIQAGKTSLTLMSARIIEAMPLNVSANPAFRLQPLEMYSRATMDGKTTTTKLNSSEQTVLADPSWQFYESETQINRAHRLDLSFPMSNDELESLKGKVVMFALPAGTSPEKLSVAWNECDGAGPVTGHYTGFACARGRFLADDYAGFIRDHLLSCVNQGMDAAGLPKATKVHIEHDGTSGDARHQVTPSLHNAGRAVDIQSMTATASDGAHVFDFRKTNTNHVLSGSCAPAGSANCKYYEAFRECWHKLQKARACAENSNPARRWIGTLGWEDKQHIAHHLHTSMPFCPHTAGHWTTSFSDEVDADGEPSDYDGKKNDGGIDI
jgi:hypothetical protein